MTLGQIEDVIIVHPAPDDVKPKRKGFLTSLSSSTFRLQAEGRGTISQARSSVHFIRSFTLVDLLGIIFAAIMADANMQAIDFLRRIMMEDSLDAASACVAASDVEEEHPNYAYEEDTAPAYEEDAPSSREKAAASPLPLNIEPCSLKQMSDHITLLECELQETIRLRTAEIDKAKGRLEYLKAQQSLKRKSEKAKHPIKRKRKTAPPPRKRKLCTTEGCTSVAKWQGVCQKHGASVRVPRCRHEGCNNQAQNVQGVCIRHGAKRRYCSIEGCNISVVKNGLCTRHGAKTPTCSHEGCTKRVQNKGVCYQHGAKKRLCKHDGCKNWARVGGVCKKHSTEGAGADLLNFSLGGHVAASNAGNDINLEAQVAANNAGNDFSLGGQMAANNAGDDDFSLGEQEGDNNAGNVFNLLAQVAGIDRGNDFGLGGEVADNDAGDVFNMLAQVAANGRGNNFSLGGQVAANDSFMHYLCQETNFQNNQS